MEKAVGDMSLLQCLVYLNDRMLEEHKKHILKVLDRLQEYGLNVSIDKCQLCQPQVKYVSHIVSAAGIAPTRKRSEQSLTGSSRMILKPCNPSMVSAGTIDGSSPTVRSLTDLTKGFLPAQRDKKAASQTTRYFKKSELFGNWWTPACCFSKNNSLSRTCSCPGLCQPSQDLYTACGCHLQWFGGGAQPGVPGRVAPCSLCQLKAEKLRNNLSCPSY